MNKMIDIHNHSLPFVDDGARSYEESRANILYLKSCGVEEIVFTSHYIVDSDYSAPVEARREIFDKLSSNLSDLGVKFYLGNEVFINDISILKKLLKDGIITTLNGSKYILIEFPLRQKLQYVENVICDLNEAGYIPIIAHPERYSYIQNDYSQVYKLLEYNCFLQSNVSSIIGNYGRTAKKTVKRMLKDNLITFIATDFHRVGNVDKVNKSLKKLKRLLGEDKLDELIYKNPKAVIENGDIPNVVVEYK